MNKTTKWTQELKDATELADQLAYALFKDEKKYAKEFEIWRDEHGVYLDINEGNEEIWNALPSGLLFWLMKKHYSLNTDGWNGGKVDIHKAIQDFWDEAERLTDTSYFVCLNFYEWTSSKQGDEDEEEEPQKELKSSNLKEANFCKDNPYVAISVDINGLDKRAFTCTGHMEVKTSDI